MSSFRTEADDSFWETTAIRPMEEASAGVPASRTWCHLLKAPNCFHVKARARAWPGEDDGQIQWDATSTQHSHRMPLGIIHAPHCSGDGEFRRGWQVIIALGRAHATVSVTPTQGNGVQHTKPNDMQGCHNFSCVFKKSKHIKSLP